jgi:hypothetical protein
METLQPGWRWCRKCQGMFYGGGENNSGICPADFQAQDGRQGAQYSVLFGEDAPGQQGNWRWCVLCQGSYFWRPNQAGRCPGYPYPYHPKAPGIVNSPQRLGTKRLRRVVTMPSFGDDAPGQQGDWRWCDRCSGWFFNGFTSKASVLRQMVGRTTPVGALIIPPSFPDFIVREAKRPLSSVRRTLSTCAEAIVLPLEETVVVIERFVQDGQRHRREAKRSWFRSRSSAVSSTPK